MVHVVMDYTQRQYATGHVTTLFSVAEILRMRVPRI